MATNRRFPRLSSLFWRIALTFLVILAGMSAVSLYVFLDSAHEYTLEVNQNLGRDVAPHTVDMIMPHYADGNINSEGIEDIFHSMMVINPSVEVYVLDKSGKILSYVAPEKVVKLENVDLAPVKKYIADTTGQLILGDDPRNPGQSNIFSAAPIMEQGQLTGYIYIILASQKFASTSHTLENSYILGLSVRTFLIVLIISAIVGLLAIWFLTRKLHPITDGIHAFRSGNFKTRIPVASNGELDQVAITFNEMAETIERNIEELKSVDKLRKEMISNISHDLRTPIASIQGYAETLMLKKDEVDAADREQYLSVIMKSSLKLKKLVDDLFELSKLESGHIALNKEPFSIAELIFDVSSKYRMLSEKRNLSINTVLSKDTPLVEGDISMIDRVLQNLIGNAVKYCNDGDSINIEVNRKTGGDLVVRIADTGPGIPQQDLPHIFDRYFTGRKPAAAGQDSTGLGLAIVKKIIDLHKSTISVQSQLQRGTVFSFTLPVVGG